MELQLQNLSKQYGTKCAVDNVNVSLTAGVYGLLGANGAGKTTLMRMICGVLKPTSGSICLNGKTIGELGEQYYTHLGYMPQDFGFYPDFTAREFMLYMATVKGLDKKQAKSRTDAFCYKSRWKPLLTVSKARCGSFWQMNEQQRNITTDLQLSIFITKRILYACES